MKQRLKFNVFRNAFRQDFGVLLSEEAMRKNSRLLYEGMLRMVCCVSFSSGLAT